MKVIQGRTFGPVVVVYDGVVHSVCSDRRRLTCGVGYRIFDFDWANSEYAETLPEVTCLQCIARERP